MLLSVALGDFLKYMKFRKGASVTTLDTYQYNLLDFINVVGNIESSDLSNKTIDLYADALSLRDIKPRTFRNKLTIVKCLVAYLYKQDICSLKPEAVELPKERHAEANFLSPEEAKKFLKQVKDIRDRAMMLTLLSSGLRVSELTDLRISDIYKRSVAVRNGKGGKPRVTFITPEAEKAIKAYLKHVDRKEGYVFANPYGARLSRVVVARKVHSYAVKAGIHKRVSTHTLRHTFATTMLKRGARTEDVQQILGHANIKTTRIYLHFTAHDLQKTYNKVMLKA
jgi:integrase/recombinase XerD